MACEQIPQLGTYQNISVQVAHRMMGRDNPNRILVLDVRYLCEYDLGHLYGAVLMPYDQLQSNISEFQAYKNQTVIVYCKAGVRSEIACEVLANSGFTLVYNMVGGIFAWINAGYEIYTTHYYAQVDIANGDLCLQIDPLLLHQTGPPPCTQNQIYTQNATCPVCNSYANNTVTIGNDTATVYATLLEQDANYIAVEETWEANGEALQFTIGLALLWNFSEATEVRNRTASLFSTTITQENVSIQYFTLVYRAISVEFNLTLYTVLLPLVLDSGVYAGSTTIAKCTSGKNAGTLSSDYVNFSSSFDTLSHQYAALGYVAHRIGTLYGRSHDDNVRQLSPNYKQMAAELRYLSDLVEEQIPQYNKVVLSGQAILADPCDPALSLLISGSCALAWVGGCAWFCAWLVETVAGYAACIVACGAIGGAICVWITNSFCGLPTTILDLGCGAVCGAIASQIVDPLTFGVFAWVCPSLCSQFISALLAGSAGGGGGGGGGCPFLYVYNGSQYVSQGLLDIHGNADTDRRHILTAAPAVVGGEYLLRLTEHPQTISHIDQVRLYATLDNGRTVQLPLTSAVHSQWGNVLSQLRFSDDRRTVELGAKWNGGTSQSIYLRFLALPPWLHATSFVFEIEGYNVIVKEA